MLLLVKNSVMKYKKNQFTFTLYLQSSYLPKPPESYWTLVFYFLFPFSGFSFGFFLLFFLLAHTLPLPVDAKLLPCSLEFGPGLHLTPITAA